MYGLKGGGDSTLRNIGYDCNPFVLVVATSIKTLNDEFN